MNKKFVSVYNTTTHSYKMIEVTPEVYREYMREKWEMENDDRSFFDHQIQFSVMIVHGSVENFREFMHLVKDTYELIESFLI
ncbi:MAG: hypothetical protein K2J71_06535 [Oscillospiraceae bacterium]|nr:hypothetical protein [Oscillospiraceae bacterium]